MNIGDIIICHDSDEACEVLYNLAIEGIEVDFKFGYVEKDCFGGDKD